MSNERALIAETAAALLQRHCPPNSVPRRDGCWSPDLWARLDEIGFTRIGLPDAAGEPPGDVRDAAVAVRAAAMAAAPLPLADTVMIAGRALATAGLDVPAGPLAAASGTGTLEVTRADGGWHLRGWLPDVPWAPVATTLVTTVDHRGEALIAALDSAACGLTASENLAGEPRADVEVDTRVDNSQIAALAEEDRELLLRYGALARGVAISGSLDRVLEICVDHVRQRTQFGRPIGRFQAVQQQLALLAGEVTAAAACTRAALLEEANESPGAAVAAAIAKLRTSEAAGTAAPIAHQLCGAIGMTDEHELALHTRRLWAWRQEWGSDAYWATWLGRVASARGGAAAWDLITA